MPIYNRDVSLSLSIASPGVGDQKKQPITLLITPQAMDMELQDYLRTHGLAKLAETYSIKATLT
jgi:hypothetical protein